MTLSLLQEMRRAFKYGFTVLDICDGCGKESYLKKFDDGYFCCNCKDFCKFWRIQNE